MVLVGIGAIATAGMTAVMYLYAAVTGFQTRVIRVLTAMFCGRSPYLEQNPPLSTLAGSIFHTGIGVLFSISYFHLLIWDIIAPNFLNAVIIGAISGLLAVGAWRFYFASYFASPRISFLHYTIALLISHIAFGIISILLIRLWL